MIEVTCCGFFLFYLQFCFESNNCCFILFGWIYMDDIDFGGGALYFVEINSFKFCQI